MDEPLNHYEGNPIKQSILAAAHQTWEWHKERNQQTWIPPPRSTKARRSEGPNYN